MTEDAENLLMTMNRLGDITKHDLHDYIGDDMLPEDYGRAWYELVLAGAIIQTNLVRVCTRHRQDNHSPRICRAYTITDKGHAQVAQIRSK